MGTYLFGIALFANTMVVLWFGRDTELYNLRDFVAMGICCLLPVLPCLYLYKWCDDFVRGIEG